MKLRRRIRSAIKWTGTVVTVLLIVVWIGSAWYFGGFRIRNLEVGAVQGQLRVFLRERSVFWPTDRTWVHGQVYPAPQFDWWFHAGWNDPKGGTSTWIPLWFPLLLFGVPTVLMWRTDRRKRRAERENLCPNAATTEPAYLRIAPAPSAALHPDGGVMLRNL